MELVAIDMTAGAAIAIASVGIFAVYVFLLGAFVAFRTEVNELLSEIFDASMSAEERQNLGPALVVPPLMGLILLGLISLVVNIAVLWIPLALTVVAAVFTAFKRKAEMKRKELEDLGRTEL